LQEKSAASQRRFFVGRRKLLVNFGGGEVSSDGGAKHLKIVAVIIRNTRCVRVLLSSAFP
jgi:hypothetical protein